MIANAYALGVKLALTATPEEEQDQNPWYPAAIGAGVAGAGLFGAGVAQGMAGNQYADKLQRTLDHDTEPLSSHETALSRYQDTMSAAVQAKPFGVPAGEIITGVRRNEALMEHLGGKYKEMPPGRVSESRHHYGQFRKGPISAYWHQMRRRAVSDPAVLEPFKELGSTYQEIMAPRLQKAWVDFRDIHSKIEGDSLQGSEYMPINEVDTQALPHKKQQEFMKFFYDSLPPELQQLRRDVETGQWGAEMVKNREAYLPSARDALKARNNMWSGGLGLAGAGLGAYLGNKLYDVSNDEEDETTLGNALSTGAGTVAGGLGGLAATRQGREWMLSLLNKLKGVIPGTKTAAFPGQKSVEGLLGFKFKDVGTSLNNRVGGGPSLFKKPKPWPRSWVGPSKVVRGTGGLKARNSAGYGDNEAQAERNRMYGQPDSPGHTTAQPYKPARRLPPNLPASAMIQGNPEPQTPTPPFKKGSSTMTTRFTRHDAVTKMSHYINYLAAKANGVSYQPLHVKQARFNGLVKLSRALEQKQDIIEAIKVAFPVMTERQRWKLAHRLTRGLGRMIKKAQRRKQAMGMMGNMGSSSNGAGQAAAGGIDMGSGGGGMLSQTTGDGTGGGGGQPPASVV